MNALQYSAVPGLRRAVWFAIVVGLSACGGSESTDTPNGSLVPVTPQGAAIAIVRGDVFSTGTTLFNATGQGFVLLSADGDAPNTVMHVVDNTLGRRAPAIDGRMSLSYERTSSQTLQPITASAAAGTYRALVGGQSTLFTVAADGSVVAGASNCKLGGKIDFAKSYGAAQPVSLTTANCGTVTSGTFNGVVFVSADTAPAAWQLVAENGSSVLDLLAFR